MTSDRYLGRYADDPSGLGTDAQWTFSLVPEQLHRALLSTTAPRNITRAEYVRVSLEDAEGKRVDASLT
jgi:hypothetical protein